MQSNTTSPQSRKLAIYFLAGVATAATFMEEFAWTVKHLYEEEGGAVSTTLLFPYGDWSISLHRQLNEIRRDLFTREQDRTLTIGGRRTAEEIRRSYVEGSIWIIGHSGGGIAGSYAAELLRREGLPVEAVVQIGSPRCRIPEDAKESTLYIYGVNHKKKRSDPITRLGSWGGWERSARGVPYWNSTKHAPGHIVPVQLIGGHPDYFRSRSPFLDQAGASNLVHVIRAIRHFDTSRKIQVVTR
jgi:pimeloyl-ACP methyl ester carboxylesterase